MIGADASFDIAVALCFHHGVCESVARAASISPFPFACASEIVKQIGEEKTDIKKTYLVLTEIVCVRIILKKILCAINTT